MLDRAQVLHVARLARLELSDEEVDAVEREVQETVERSVEFAKNGTDPKPEDALKNIYA